VNEIFVNGRFLVHPLTGVQRYAREITNRIFADIHLIRGGRPGFLGHLWEQTILPGNVPKGSVLWSPANSGPIHQPCQVVTIHDLAALEFPQWFPAPMAAWYAYMLPKLAKQAVLILTVSQFSKARITERLGVAEEIIRMIPGAAGQAFHLKKPTSQQIRKPYFLTVGSFGPRKNSAVMLEAWVIIQERNPDIELRVVGTQLQRKEIEPIPSVRLLGQLSDEQMCKEYQGALGFIYPSRYEGFGLPVLEAMACGTPVICAQVASLPEVTGNAALYFNPDEPEELAAQMAALLQNNALREDLVRRGTGQVQKFSWDYSAQKVLSILKELAE
jgi:glycosyltransferase involved in cell wall biosynthesis